MATPSNHYKLGLFVLVGVSAAIAAAVLLGVATSRKHTIGYHSYFNESVQGLELGSPVKFRGVTIGHVSAIEIAPDHRMVDVISELDAADIKRMGLTEQGGHAKKGGERFAIPPDLRVQLGSQGITGVKFVAIDFFDVKSNPPPTLPFDVPAARYIPAAQSMMKNLEDTVTKAMDRLPEMVDAIVAIMGRVDRLLGILEKEGVPEKVAAAIGHADQAMITVDRTLGRIDRANLGEKAAGTLNDLRVAVNNMDDALEHLAGDKGVFASVQHASDAFGEIGRNGKGTQRDLEATLRDVSEAAEAIRSLVEALDRDPDMLLKGKSRAPR
jgi:paraquat-inducible protein B